MKKIIITLSTLILANCKTINLEKKTDLIVAVKIMNVYDYPFATNRKSFWNVGIDEHAKLEIPLEGNFNFFETVKQMPISSSKEFGVLKHAFILKSVSKSKNDTIYADHQLNTWMVVENEKVIYYQDEDGFLSTYLKQKYFFFNECW
jgi:hypothetical protein